MAEVVIDLLRLAVEIHISDESFPEAVRRPF
jgi:hypothetical protein